MYNTIISITTRPIRTLVTMYVSTFKTARVKSEIYLSSWPVTLIFVHHVRLLFFFPAM